MKTDQSTPQAGAMTAPLPELPETMRFTCRNHGNFEATGTECAGYWLANCPHCGKDCYLTAVRAEPQAGAGEYDPSAAVKFAREVAAILNDPGRQERLRALLESPDLHEKIVAVVNSPEFRAIEEVTKEEASATPPAPDANKEPAREGPTPESELSKLAQKFIGAFFGHAKDKPRISIPAQPDDDDLRLMALIDAVEQRAEAAERLLCRIQFMTQCDSHNRTAALGEIRELIVQHRMELDGITEADLFIPYSERP